MPPKLHQLLNAEAVVLDLRASSKDTAVGELLAALDLDETATALIRENLSIRESQGSTGLGHGVAMPHARSEHMRTLRLAYGRSVPGIDWEAMDGEPVHHAFLLLAPPVEVSSDYLPVMGNLARFVRDPKVSDALDAVEGPGEFLALLEERGY